MLDKWRKEIDKIDWELIKLLAQRMQIVEEIWIYKKANWIAVIQKWRWQEVLKSRKAIAKGLWLKEEFVEDIWNRMHEYAINLEQ